MKKLKNLLSIMMTVVFIMSLLPTFGSKVKAESTIIADTMVVLVGDFVETQDLGKNWDPKNEKTMMNEYMNGVYEFIVDFKQAGDYNYKVALNGTWDQSYGDSNGKDGNKLLSVKAPGKVIFRFDLKNKSVYDSINNGNAFKKTGTLVGALKNAIEGGKEWDPSDSNFDMEYIGGGFYKKNFTVKVGSFEYKIAYDHAWSNGEVATNRTCKVEEEGQVTFCGNDLIGLATDSASNPDILKTISLVGTLRGNENDNWNEKLTGFEFSPLSGDGKFIYSVFLKEGKYEYKAVENYSWDGALPSSGNRNLSVASGGKYVVFICDTKEKAVYDSVNHSEKIAEILGFEAAGPAVPQELKPLINANGTVTFFYRNPEAKEVYLAGAMTEWEVGKKLMTKDKDGIWSITLRVGDNAQTLEYKYIVDGKWITDPSNDKIVNGNSAFDFPAYDGRKVVLPGSIQGAIGDKNWDPASDKTTLHYDGNGMYSITLKSVPAGTYEYKIAMGSWEENYGLEGKPDGANIKVTIAKTQDITFWYNDDSHNVVDSVSYQMLQVKLSGTGIAETAMLDTTLSGIYSAKITLKKGIYKDLVVKTGEKVVPAGTINISAESKLITISYDPKTDSVFNDASDKVINLSEVSYNSREEEYKAPFGAVANGSKVTFNLKVAKDDITSGKLILSGSEGVKILPMSKNGCFDGSHDKWTVTYVASKIGSYQYYFVISNGSDVKAYGDDDGYFGLGKADELGKVKKYDLNVYVPGFKTPDWFKDAVVYQIFPDRFFNGDITNDYAQKLARGNAPYEVYRDWYAIPENPNLEFEKDEKGAFKLDKDGKPIVRKDYTGTIGDGYKGVFCNEMYGGDLVGIQKKLDYLQALGVNVLYLNPVSASISNHRYDTTDYRKIDPLLGNLDNFVKLTKEAKKRGMNVILDGVFNHVSDDSVYFDRYAKYIAKGKPLGAYQYWSKVYDLVNAKAITKAEAEKQVTSALAAQGITDLHYKEWFVVNNKIVDKDNGGNTVPKHYEYEGWWGYDSMPVVQALNGSEYNVKTWDSEIIDGKDANSRYWLKNGSSGWRLDVANEVSDETWQYFRKAVKKEGNNNVVVGEIWTDASHYLLGDMYDSVMNYRFRDAILGYVRGEDSVELTIKKLETIREQYPKEAFYAMMNLLDSHDTERILTSLDGIVKDKNDEIIAKPATDDAKKLLKLVPLIQMTYPGAPCIYYGDEMGMVGAKDPDCRRGTIWGKGDKELVEWYAKLANIRDEYEVLRTGEIVQLSLENTDVLAYQRDLKEKHAVVLVNRGGAINSCSVKVNLSNGTKLTDAISGKKYVVADGKVTVSIPEKLGLILVTNYKAVTIDIEKLKDAYDSSFIVPVKNDN